MPKPKTKTELIEVSQNSFDKLNELINGFSEKELHLEFPKGTLNRNIRDVVAHLHHWNKLMLGWYETGMANEKTQMPSEGFTWKETPDLNKKIQKQYESTELNKTRNLLKNSFVKLQKIIKKHSNGELFEKKKYKWTGSTSLGAYLISATSSHYKWAYNLIKKNIDETINS